MGSFRGTDGNDTLRGTEEPDIIRGGGGLDRLFGLGGGDRIFGDDARDTIRGGDGDDLVVGGGGDDILYGEAGDDRLTGGVGNDFLRGGAGRDRHDGGDGIDSVSFFEPAATQGVVVDLRTQRIANDGFGNAERMTSIEGFGQGTVLADVFYGNAAANQLTGNRGDRVYGFGGDDTLSTEDVAGARFDGGGGNDTFLIFGYRTEVDAAGQFVFLDAERGAVVDLSRRLVLDDGFGASARLIGFENVGGTARDDSIRGDGGVNALSGGEGNDRIYGMDGDDVLVGGLGIDRLVGGAGSDRFEFAGFQYLGFLDFTGQLALSDPDSGRTTETADRIFDFEQGAGGDTIDLSGIDAIVGGGDDAFTFLGTGAFTGAAGEARYETVRNVTYLYLEVGGREGADMVIRLDGIIQLTANDLIL